MVMPRRSMRVTISPTSARSTASGLQRTSVRSTMRCRTLVDERAARRTGDVQRSRDHDLVVGRAAIDRVTNGVGDVLDDSDVIAGHTELPRRIRNFFRISGARDLGTRRDDSVVLSDSERVEHLERILLTQHSQDPRTARTREFLVERGAYGARSGDVLRAVDDYKRAVPDDFEPTR